MAAGPISERNQGEPCEPARGDRGAAGGSSRCGGDWGARASLRASGWLCVCGVLGVAGRWRGCAAFLAEAAVVVLCGPGCKGFGISAPQWPGCGGALNSLLSCWNCSQGLVAEPLICNGIKRPC